MPRSVAVILLVLAACAARSTLPPRDDLRCTPASADMEATCAARGSDCAVMPEGDRCPIVAPGLMREQPTAERLDEERARELGTIPCECACQSDLEKCRMAASCRPTPTLTLTCDSR
jgi:hypothetical protein